MVGLIHADDAAGPHTAQLYHANENHTYNIISCRNYGSIYGRNKTDTEKGANDSAGSLGNVTACDAAAQGNGQHFTISIFQTAFGIGLLPSG